MPVRNYTNWWHYFFGPPYASHSKTRREILRQVQRISRDVGYPPFSLWSYVQGPRWVERGYDVLGFREPEHLIAFQQSGYSKKEAPCVYLVRKYKIAIHDFSFDTCHRDVWSGDDLNQVTAHSDTLYWESEPGPMSQIWNQEIDGLIDPKIPLIAEPDTNSLDMSSPLVRHQ